MTDTKKERMMLKRLDRAIAMNKRTQERIERLGRKIQKAKVDMATVREARAKIARANA